MSVKRRAKKHHEEENHERWLVSYADFITLLFAFFVVLFATSNSDEKKQKEFEDSVKKYMYKMAVLGGGGGTDKKGPNQHINYDSPINSPIHQYNSAANTASAEKLQEIEKQLEEVANSEEISKFLQEMTNMEWGLRLSLPSNSVFAKNSLKFTPEAVRFFNELIPLLKKQNSPIVIEAHNFDSKYPQGVDNPWDYSALQASQVLRYFLKVHNITPEKLSSQSYGNSKPIYSKKSSKNSRIDIVLLTEGKPY